MTPAKKKTKAKPSTRKKTPAKKPARAAKAAKSRDRGKKPSPKRAKPQKTARPAAPQEAKPRPAPPVEKAAPRDGDRPKSRLGAKYECFSCGAKFYDLNKPEPTCPRCGADQRDRPKQVPKVKLPLPTSERRRGSTMVPLFDDEDDEAVITEDEDLGLGLPAPGAPDNFLEEADAEDEEADEV